MINALMGLLKLLFVIPMLIVMYLFAFIVIAVIFIGIAAVCAAPFVLIIGLVLMIFF